ncbi:1,4-alpha-glucan-branching enzyme [Parasponia andersonii]|uniref:1,4-alpha-glucan-branching enzyme n=1 Tax=Parasponia andersonii TaxID=3476 RepID=A0A2P5D3Y3_PARAD|nr:1,4-alpha-glucan-branching enzyme [Parasponia andersonii]
MGISSNKLVLGFPYHGYAWKLANPRDNYIGAPANGPAINTEDGSMRYKDVKDYMKRNGVVSSKYNDSYVVNSVTVGSTWIAFDDVEAIKTKVSYAKKNRLLGYYAWQVSSDDNSILSRAGTFIK